MNKKRITLRTPEEIAEFINISSSFTSDINVWNGHIVIDAKSIVSMFGITDGKIIDVEIISSDNKEIERFIDEISRFEVKK